MHDFVVWTFYMFRSQKYMHGIYTSVVSVAILLEADEVDVQLWNQDFLRIDAYESSGSCGQHANTTDSVVSITHSLSGLTVAIQYERPLSLDSWWFLLPLAACENMISGTVEHR
ncbi:putative peptide chain release factor 1 [Tanacetum coccineum]